MIPTPQRAWLGVTLSISLASLGVAPSGASDNVTAGASTVRASASAAVPAPVAGFPIGWCIRANKPQTFVDAKSAGYEFVELALQDVLSLSEEDFDRLASTIRSSAPPVLAGYNPIPKDLVLLGPAADATKIDGHLSRLMARASALKLRYVIFNSGAAWRRPDGMTPEEGFAQLVAFSRKFAGLAAARGITVLVQPLRSSDSNQVTTIAEALKLIEAVGRPNDFALMVDYSFLTLQKDDPAGLRAAGKLLRHVHIANPANNRKYATADSESDYASFFKVLREIGYRGGISVHGGPLSPETWAEDTAKTITFLRTKAAQLAQGR